MKTLKAIVVATLLAVSLVPAVTATDSFASKTTCVTTGSDEPNHLSSLSSTSEGGNVTCKTQK